MKRILVIVERRRPLICFEVFFGTIRPLFLTKKGPVITEFDKI